MNGLGRGNDNKEKRKIVTKESLGMTMLLFGALVFLIAVTGSAIFGEMGLAILGFLYGLTGYHGGFLRKT